MILPSHGVQPGCPLSMAFFSGGVGGVEGGGGGGGGGVGGGGGGEKGGGRFAAIPLLFLPMPYYRVSQSGSPLFTPPISSEKSISSMKTQTSKELLSS